MSVVSDRTFQITKGDGGAQQSQRHGPALVDEWAFLNTKLSNESITQQVRGAPLIQIGKIGRNQGGRVGVPAYQAVH